MPLGDTTHRAAYLRQSARLGRREHLQNRTVARRRCPRRPTTLRKVTPEGRGHRGCFLESARVHKLFVNIRQRNPPFGPVRGRSYPTQKSIVSSTGDISKVWAISLSFSVGTS